MSLHAHSICHGGLLIRFSAPNIKNWISDNLLKKGVVYVLLLTWLLICGCSQIHWICLFLVNIEKYQHFFIVFFIILYLTIDNCWSKLLKKKQCAHHTIVMPALHTPQSPHLIQNIICVLSVDSLFSLETHLSL